ncbi:MAG: hypothetical protein L0211_06415 [Planctomycetaceae bacterium]|nr:hypothetical protein [Planctomycetaceae bacterium]
MQFALPHIDKFIPMWACFGAVLVVIAAFVAVLVVVATSRRGRENVREQ